MTETSSVHSFGRIRRCASFRQWSYFLSAIAVLLGTVSGRPAPYKQTDKAEAVATDEAGNVVITGYSRSRTMLEGYTAKYSGRNGALLWERRFGAGEESGRGIVLVVDRHGNVTITGMINRGQMEDLYTARYNGGDGKLIWENITNFQDRSRDEPILLAVDLDGNAFVTGTTSLDAIGAFTLKLNGADGKPLWRESLTNRNRPSGLVVDGLGNVIVRGSSVSGGTTYLTKYNGADGTIAWENSFTAPSTWERPGRTLALDTSNNVVMMVSGGGDGSMLFVRKHAARDGHLLWEVSHTLDQAPKVTLHGLLRSTTDDVFIHGEISDTPGKRKLYVARYRGSDGERLWETIVESSNAQGAQAIGFAGVLIALASLGYGLRTRSRWYLLAVGIIIVLGIAKGVRSPWHTRFQRDIWLTSADVDSEGNLKTLSALSSGGHHVAKFAAWDGRILWQHWNMGAERIALLNAGHTGGSSNIIVAGTSPVGNSNEDIYLRNVSGEDGTTIWENYDDAGSRVAEIDKFWTLGAEREVADGLTAARFLYRELDWKLAISRKYERELLQTVSRARSVVHLTSVQFAGDEAILTPEARETLYTIFEEPLVRKVLRLPVTVFVVADGVIGTNGVNLQVSEQRAEAVSDALRAIGVSHPISAIGSAGDPRRGVKEPTGDDAAQVRIFLTLRRSSFEFSDPSPNTE